MTYTMINRIGYYFQIIIIFAKHRSAFIDLHFLLKQEHTFFKLIETKIISLSQQKMTPS